MSERNVYGGVFIPRFEYVREKHGLDGVKKLIRRMREHEYTGPTDPAEFKIAQKYPVEYILIFFRSYIEVFGEGNFDHMAREVAKKRGIVGWFVKWAAKPDLLVKKAAEYWPNFYDFGRLEGEVTDPNRGILRGYDVSPEPMFCRVLTNYYAGILENLRIKGISSRHTKCVHEGDALCEWELTWAR